MRDRKFSRRDVLKASTVMAVGIVFSEPLKATPPEPTPVSPAMIQAAQREGIVAFYTAMEIPVAEKLGKTFEAKYPGIAVRLKRSGAERVFQRIGKKRRSRSTRSMSSAAQTQDILSIGIATACSRLMCQRT